MRSSDWSSDVCSSDLVRISTPEGFGNFFRASRSGALATAHPRLAVEMITIQQIVALSRREADVAVTMTLPPGGNFLHEHLTDYRLFVYGSRTYLASAPPIRSRDDLGDHPFIGYVDDLIFTRALNYLRSEEHTSELQSLMRIPYAVFC